MWLLKVTVRKSDGTDHPAYSLYLQPGTYTLGRKGTDVVLYGDDSISRSHAQLTVPSEDGAALHLADAASRYGTWVNSTRLEKGTSVAVGEGDALQFGHHSHAQLQPVPVRLHLLPSAQVDTTELASELGFAVTEAADGACTHVVAEPGEQLTPAAACQLLAGRLLVAPAWCAAHDTHKAACMFLHQRKLRAWPEDASPDPLEYPSRLAWGNTPVDASALPGRCRLLAGRAFAALPGADPAAPALLAAMGARVRACAGPGEVQAGGAEVVVHARGEAAPAGAAATDVARVLTALVTGSTEDLVEPAAIRAASQRASANGAAGGGHEMRTSDRPAAAGLPSGGKPAVGPSAVPGAAAPPAGAPQPAAGRAGGAPERTAAARQAGAQPQRPAGGANGVVQCGPGQGAELLGRRTPGGVVGAAAAAGAADGGPADGSAGGGGDSAADSPLALANGGAHEAEAGDEGASTVHMPGLLVRAYTPGGARRDADAYAPDLASVPDFKAFRKVAHAGGRRARRAFAPERDYYETLADTEAFLRAEAVKRARTRGADELFEAKLRARKAAPAASRATRR